LQVFSEQMVKSLLEAPQLAYMDHTGKGEDKRIIVYMGGIRNETKEHINLESMNDSISTELLRSKRFRFVADQKGQTEIGDQVRFQNESGRVDEQQAKKFGHQLGADVVLYGTLYSIGKKDGRSLDNLGTKTEDVYYQFAFKCLNIETGEIIWQENKDIRKTQKTGIFG
jgi:uncharacterized protein (TIGR02722 family)